MYSQATAVCVTGRGARVAKPRGVTDVGQKRHITTGLTFDLSRRKSGQLRTRPQGGGQPPAKIHSTEPPRGGTVSCGAREVQERAAEKTVSNKQAATRAAL